MTEGEVWQATNADVLHQSSGCAMPTQRCIKESGVAVTLDTQRQRHLLGAGGWGHVDQD